MSQETKNYQYERNDFNTYGVRGSASGGGTEVVANPTLAGTESALTGLQVDNTKYKVDSGISQSDADARYLKLAGGTMTGNVLFDDTKGLYNTGYYPVIVPQANNVTEVGNTGGNTKIITPAGSNVVHQKGTNTYDMLDTSNGLASSGGNMTGAFNLTGSINNGNSQAILTTDNANTMVGNIGNLTVLRSSNTSIRHNKNGTLVEMYDETNGVGYTTTAPTANNTKGGLVMVVLSAEPSTYYNGYYYIIAPTP